MSGSGTASKRKRDDDAETHLYGDGEPDDTSGVDDAASFMATKFRSAMDDAASEFICPITQELPVDPVTAMDGRVYERKAIETWVARGTGKSPLTNMPMGDLLLPALHVRNSLELMVRSGALTGEKVDAWQKKMQDEATVASVRAKAEGGCARSMGRLGSWYLHGMRGLDESVEEAVAWFQRGVDGGDVSSLALLGYIHVTDWAAPFKPALGLIMLTEAAMRGCDVACWQLGKVFASGRKSHALGLDRDSSQVAKWYRKLAECNPDGTSMPLKPEIRAKALDWLRRYDAALEAQRAGGAVETD